MTTEEDFLKVLETKDKDLIHLVAVGFLDVKIINGEVHCKPTKEGLEYAERKEWELKISN